MPATTPPIQQTAADLTAAMYRAGMSNVHVEPMRPPKVARFKLQRAKTHKPLPRF